MKQLSLDKKEKYEACAFTGHREVSDDFPVEALREAIEKLVEKGVKTFYNGGARGFDLLAAETVLNVREKLGVRLVICVPYYGQEKGYSELDKERYNNVLKNADEVVTLAEHYFRGCLHKRNDYMVERADALIAYCLKDEGGAAYTVKKFRKKKGENVFFVGGVPEME